jgi:hypothetical protein
MNRAQVTAHAYMFASPANMYITLIFGKGDNSTQTSL